MIKAFIEKHKWLLSLIGVFILAEIIIDPIADLPLNDDWTYARSVKTTLETGTINISPLSSASLFTHIVWGTMFVKIFGFSFNVLRFSTLISALISILFFNKLVVRITGSNLVGVISSAVILFNPIYFNSANTYMTDVNFITLTVICMYFAFDFFVTQSAISFLMMFVSSILATLLRQYGIIIPLCFVFACLFIPNKRWLYFAVGIIGVVVVFLVFGYFESYLKSILPPNSSYKFSGQNSLSDPQVFQRFIDNLNGRYRYLILHITIYGFPFLALFAIDLFKRTKWWLNLLVVTLSAVVTHLLFYGMGFPLGNVFANMHVGAETFYQTFEGGFHYELQHYSEAFQQTTMWIKYIFTTGSLTWILLGIIKLFEQKGSFKPQSGFVFTFSLIIGYACMVSLTEGFFDRYQLPIVVCSIVMFAVLMKYHKADLKIAGLPLIVFIYISVFGTRDYIEMNRKRWEAYGFLTNYMNAKPAQINAGYEVAGWTGDGITDWHYFMMVEPYKYLVQYKTAPGFKRVRDYEFQRYFPYKKDKISIFVNLHQLVKK